MTRQTSIDVYNKIKESGLLGRRQFQVYHVLKLYGPMTVNEVFKKVGEEFNEKVVAYYAHSQARLTECCSLGVVREIPKRLCSVTGNSINGYEVTDEMPIKYMKPKTNKQILKDAIEFIKDNQLLEKYEDYAAQILADQRAKHEAMAIKQSARALKRKEKLEARIKTQSNHEVTYGQQ